MIIFAEDRRESVNPKPRGGEGQIEGRHWLTGENRPDRSHFKQASQMTLPPGSSIGFHPHPDDEEVYVIVSGRGRYTGPDGRSVEVGPGDLTLTRSGEGHGLANIGDEPLIFIAVIVD